MKALISIVFLSFVMGIMCNKEYIRVELGGSVTFDCYSNATVRCILLKNKNFEADRDGGTKFHAVNSTEFCRFEATDLNFTDNGHYHCHMKDKMFTEFVLLVTVKPHEPELWYSGERFINNTRKLVTTRPDGSVDFECRSFQGYPKASFLWFVNDTLRLDAREEIMYAGGLLNVKSILTVNFDEMQYSFDELRRNKNREKLVKCAVVHDAYNFNESRALFGVFGKAYSTEEVRIKENYLDDIINPGESKEIICEADGLPEANDFRIQRLNTKKGWDLVSNETKTNVSLSGVYRCEARNTENGTYVLSKEITIQDPVVLSRSKTTNFGAILGGVFGALLLIVILVGIGYFIFCRKAKTGKHSEKDAIDERETHRMNDKPAVEKIITI
uniref:Ig-like domain-containing protein n=1 Tax=Strigamia maritima TaxID=126957 RepID=T1IXH1_STRMM